LEHDSFNISRDFIEHFTQVDPRQAPVRRLTKTISPIFPPTIPISLDIKIVKSTIIIYLYQTLFKYTNVTQLTLP